MSLKYKIIVFGVLSSPELQLSMFVITFLLINSMILYKFHSVKSICNLHKNCMRKTKKHRNAVLFAIY